MRQVILVSEEQYKFLLLGGILGGLLFIAPWIPAVLQPSPDGAFRLWVLYGVYLGLGVIDKIAKNSEESA
jgi:hypothetical protein